MRTISSFTLVGTLLPPRNCPVEGCAAFGAPVGPGKMPACNSTVALELIMQSGMVLLGKGEPGTTPAGATPPGQFANNRAGATVEGTLTVSGNTAPVPAPLASGYTPSSGTVWFRVCP